MVTAFPQVTLVKLLPEIDFLILATDGIWDNMTNSQVVTFVSQGIQMGHSLEDIAQDMVKGLQQAFGERQDNMTVIIVKFKAKSWKKEEFQIEGVIKSMRV